jgi:hypothetical protein
MRKFGLILIFCLSCGMAAAGQNNSNRTQNTAQNQTPAASKPAAKDKDKESGNKLDAYFGYQYTRQTFGNLGAFNLNGGIGQMAYNFNNWAGVAGEFSVSEVRHVNGALVNGGAMATFLGGPRVRLRRGPLQPYFQGLFGGAHMDSTMQADLNSATGNGIAVALGGGLDWNFSPRLAFRLAQADYFLTRFDNSLKIAHTQNNFRYSTGLVIRF